MLFSFATCTILAAERERATCSRLPAKQVTKRAFAAAGHAHADASGRAHPGPGGSSTRLRDRCPRRRASESEPARIGKAQLVGHFARSQPVQLCSRRVMAQAGLYPPRGDPRATNHHRPSNAATCEHRCRPRPRPEPTEHRHRKPARCHAPGFAGLPGGSCVLVQ